MDVRVGNPTDIRRGDDITDQSASNAWREVGRRRLVFRLATAPVNESNLWELL